MSALSLIRRGIRLPPSGWVLAALLAFYVLAGLFGRDPWRGEDAIHIGTAWHMLQFSDWLSPDLAGRAFHEPPLYYWSAALTGKLFGWLLPAHEAMRLASGLWVTLALVGLYYAARELYGQQYAAAGPLMLAGSVGLVLHAHDAQPMLVALAAYGGCIGALAAMNRRPRLSGLFFALSVAGCLLGAGIAPTLPLLALLPIAWWCSSNRIHTLQTLGIGLTAAALIAAPWPALLYTLEPLRFSLWLNAELSPLQTSFYWHDIGRYAAMLPWFAFPSLPLAIWTLRLRRRAWRTPAILLPLALLLLTLAMLALAYRPREIPALLLLPPLALLAVPGVLALRRGATNAFDWFAMMTFTLAVSLVWLAWSAMALGWPTRLAARVVALRPGFSGEFSPVALLIGLTASLWWLWLIVTAPRSPYRSLTHWTMGLTTLWLLATTLILPWFDYGKSYRPVAQAIAAALPDGHGCIAERGLSDAQRASLSYFIGLEPVALNTPAGRQCEWLLVAGDTPQELASPDRRWRLVAEGMRPTNRKEKIRLLAR